MKKWVIGLLVLGVLSGGSYASNGKMKRVSISGRQEEGMVGRPARVYSSILVVKSYAKVVAYDKHTDSVCLWKKGKWPAVACNKQLKGLRLDKGKYWILPSLRVQGVTTVVGEGGVTVECPDCYSTPTELIEG